MRKIASGFGLAVATMVSSAVAQNATTAGEVTSPYPTLHNLSLEWAITGDANTNATATVRYSKTGESSKRDGLPLFRVPQGTLAGHAISNKLAGSLFGLEPKTSYDIELSLVDPDGGSSTQNLTATTRALPVAPSGMRTIPVTPASIGSALDRAAPGDVLELAAGTYPSIVVLADGTASLPIILRAAAASGIVVEGDVRLDGRSHVWVEGLTIKGKIKCNDGAWLVIRGCTINTPEFGIVAYGDGISNSYIAENVIAGATAWAEGALGVDGNNIGEGVQITGPGNVVAFNRVSGFRDCLSLLEEDEAVEQRSIDMYGNDLSTCADDAIEADYSMGNVRVYQNRIANSFMGISSQPSLGGPTYFVRNVMYNVIYEPFKLHNGSQGDVILHNTVVKSGDALIVATDDAITRATFRNNLFLGGPGGDYNGYDTGTGNVMMLASADPTCSLDYDGFATSAGSFTGRLGSVRFASVSEMQTNTTESHGVDVGKGAFAASVTYPADPFHAPAMPSLTLAANGTAVDRGTPLANVNDGFSGVAPDLGAYEVGQAEPKYGPSGDLGAPAGGANAGGANTGGTNGGGANAAGANASGGLGNGGSASGGATPIVSAGSSGAGTLHQGVAGNVPAEGASEPSSGCGCRLDGGRRPPIPVAWMCWLIGAGLTLGRRTRRRGVLLGAGIARTTRCR